MHDDDDLIANYLGHNLWPLSGATLQYWHTFMRSYYKTFSSIHISVWFHYWGNIVPMCPLSCTMMMATICCSVRLSRNYLHTSYWLLLACTTSSLNLYIPWNMLWKQWYVKFKINNCCLSYENYSHSLIKLIYMFIHCGLFASKASSRILVYLSPDICFVLWILTITIILLWGVRLCWMCRLKIVGAFLVLKSLLWPSLTSLSYKNV